MDDLRLIIPLARDLGIAGVFAWLIWCELARARRAESAKDLAYTAALDAHKKVHEERTIERARGDQVLQIAADSATSTGKLADALDDNNRTLSRVGALLDDVARRISGLRCQ